VIGYVKHNVNGIRNFRKLEIQDANGVSLNIYSVILSEKILVSMYLFKFNILKPFHLNQFHKENYETRYDPGLFLGVKRSKCEADHSPSSANRD
jgi:hypothetical protein